jgi:DNA (cytosine-5)-methyltransferase 1
MNELHLFAGAGGGILGGMLLGHRTVCAVEIEPYCRKVLLQRQRDGILPWFPIWDDVRTFDGTPWRGIVDVVCGGFPCQDISVAGKGAGIDGERSGLWGEMARIIGEVRPRYVFVENSPALVFRGLGRVLGDLSQMGFDARWGTLGGSAVGNSAEGERLWIFSTQANRPVLASVDVSKYIKPGSEKSRRRQLARAVRKMLSQDDYSGIKRDPHAVACSMDRLKAIGNGQVPVVAAIAWRALSIERNEWE